MEKILVRYRGKTIRIDCQRAGLFGLMFKFSSFPNLVFKFRKNVSIAITSLFVFFPFLVVWLDEKNQAIDFKIIRPFTLSANASEKFRSFIEVPLNSKNKKIVGFFVGKGEKFKYIG